MRRVLRRPLRLLIVASWRMMEWEDVSLFVLLVPFVAALLLTVILLDGFFDAGMLLHALKGLNAEREQRGEKPARRRFVGKKLHLNEY